MNFLIQFHKNPVSILYVCARARMCVGGRVNPIFIDEETDHLRNKCFLGKTYLNHKAKMNTERNWIHFLQHFVFWSISDLLYLKHLKKIQKHTVNAQDLYPGCGVHWAPMMWQCREDRIPSLEKFSLVRKRLITVAIYECH